jgi:TM2 domain-containing membrane protein YozV
MIKENVGGIDRTLRIIVGSALTAVGLWSFNWLGIVGLVLLFTATLSWCPLYLPFGFSTSHKEKKANS